MFIESLQEILDNRTNLESNLTITRYIKANLQLTRPQFNSLKMIQNKKKPLGSSPTKNDAMACTLNSLSTSDSTKVNKLQLINIGERESLELNKRSAGRENGSNLLRETFGNFRIFKSYMNTVKSSFQIGSTEKKETDRQKEPEVKKTIIGPMVMNICYKAPTIVGRSQKPQKRRNALSDLERQHRKLILPRESPKRDIVPLTPPNESKHKRLPTIDVKQTQQDKPATTSPSKNQLSLTIPSRPKGYLWCDAQCLAFFKSRNPLYTGEMYNKCKKIKVMCLTAERVCAVHSQNLELIYSDAPKDQDPIQIASLSKIVTAFLSILICRKYDIDVKTYKCRVSDEASMMPGTSAQLQSGDSLTVQQLLYGLMLPSGNDAAVALADNLGRVILKTKPKTCKTPPFKIFVNHMNILYREIIGNEAMVDPNDSEQETIYHLFQNPSGLSLNCNTTLPQQITLFSAVAYKNELFRQIVTTKQYEASFRNDRYGLDRKLIWKNTNKLLWKDWEGVKTGSTENAGPCFIGKKGTIMIGIFNCGGQNKRFSEAVTLLEMLEKALEG